MNYHTYLNGQWDRQHETIEEAVDRAVDITVGPQYHHTIAKPILKHLAVKDGEACWGEGTVYIRDEPHARAYEATKNGDNK